MAIYVSLTTIPSRENDVRLTLSSLLNQTLLPDQIFVHYCKSYERLGSQALCPSLLEEYSSHPKVSFKEVLDEGPVTKYLYSGSLIKEPEDVILFCDDDVSYSPLAVELLVRHLNKGKKQAVGFWGRILKQDFRFNTSYRVYDRSYRWLPQFPIQVDLLMGIGMIGIKAKNFPKEIKASWKKALSLGPRSSIWLTDDIFINALLSQHGIKRKVIPGWENSQRRKSSYPLWQHNQDGNHNDRSLSFFKSSLSPLAHAYSLSLMQKFGGQY